MRFRSLAVVTLMLGILATFANPARAATPTHVGEDPYRSGCAASAYAANTGAVRGSNGNTIATVENWFSAVCVTNWAVMRWTNGNGAFGSQLWIASNKNGLAYSFDPAHQQCYPESCSSPAYTGAAQPMWTNMIEGVDVACISAAHTTGSGDYGTTRGWAACA
jgi:hypothetical protein